MVTGYVTSPSLCVWQVNTHSESCEIYFSNSLVPQPQHSRIHTVIHDTSDDDSVLRLSFEFVNMSICQMSWTY